MKLYIRALNYAFTILLFVIMFMAKTEAGVTLLKDINPSGNSTPFDLININGTLFFGANDDTHGRELWKSDGTKAGTVMVKDINPQGDSQEKADGDWNYAEIQGMLYFGANDGIHGIELWKSDGTEEGTIMVKDIDPDSTAVGSRPSNLINVNGILFFGAQIGSRSELWKSDGTETGTVKVKDVYLPSAGNSGSQTMAILDGILYFAGYERDHGSELWKSDGTEDGTTMVKDINPNGSGMPYAGFYITNVNGTLFFAADDGIHGTELWKSDGTEEGTAMVKDINPNAWDSLKEDTLVGLNGLVFFLANDGTHHRELWRSDGTESGTFMVKDIHPTHLNPSHELISVGETLFLDASDGPYVTGLWKSDGTEDGTVLVKYVEPLGFKGMGCLTDCNGILFFCGDDSVNGSEPWISNGTEESTVMVADINTRKGYPYWVGDSYPGRFTYVNGHVLFAAGDSGTYGRELWRFTPTGPVADAGPDRTAFVGATVTLDGSNSYDHELGISSYEWTQIAGKPITLSNDTSKTPSFTAPEVRNGENYLEFELTVANSWHQEDTDFVTIKIMRGSAIPYFILLLENNRESNLE